MRPLAAGGLLLIIALGGCADNAYYQTRALPSSSDESFGFGERLFWRGDDEVYELPAKPPARERNEDEEHRSRAECRQPGQHFLPRPIVAVEPTAAPSQYDAPAGPIGGYDDRPRVPNGPKTQPAVPLVAWRDPVQHGARERLPQPGIGGYDDRVKSQPASGTRTNQPTPVAGMNEDDGWCPPARR